MSTMIECRQLRHSYGDTPVLHGLDFRVEEGGIFGLLGKNGAGKSTAINILMGFLRPQSGECRVLGHPSHALPPAVRQDIGLLHEGFIQYDFMSIDEIERFHAPFYPRWDRSAFYDLVDQLNLPRSRRVSRMSCGQRSQVVLGLIMAQNPRLMILDDYSMGLDVGYRRLFLDLLRDYVRERGTTVLLTSHVVQELEKLIDRMIVLQAGRVLVDCTRADFMERFRQYRLPRSGATDALRREGPVVNVERNLHSVSVFGYADRAAMAAHLSAHGVAVDALEEVPMGFEDAFIGLTGRA
ncbi:ATP-binding cassette domain-containing protein [Rhodospirillum centenum]|uniref:ABC transporter, ATP binding protein, putative n=1 Tax=Rhodospirillum centenum (strain ATCC 51521 / SW) TaxID=414684 RepID=B6IY07_RHOCS|nr:ABC transporter ATP-binding protein [Rhodospirillum centenum]ACJ01181.1 ABC transporter, ATP binding protein, putative [Rhodospirillum centenum SW]